MTGALTDMPLLREVTLTIDKVAFHRGFTLIEILVTIVIVGLVMLALSKVIMVNYDLSHLAMQTREASEALKNKMVEIKSIDSITIAQGGNWSYEDIADGTATINDTYGNYTLNWSVTSHSTPTDYKAIDITATWQDGNGTSQSKTLSSIIREQDPAKQGNAI